MKFPRLKPKDYTLIAIVVVAVLFFVYAIRNERENFVDNGWKMDDGTLLSVSITEDGTLWGITPDNAIWRKVKGGSWTQTKARAAAGTNISGIDANMAAAVDAVQNNFVITTDGGNTWMPAIGKAKWVSAGDRRVLGIVSPSGEIYVGNGRETLVNTGSGLMISVGDEQNIYTITADSYVYKWVSGAWQNQGFTSRFVAAAKGGLLVSIGTDGKVQQREGSGPLTAFSGDNIRNISASSTMLAATTNDNKTWTMDIATAKAAAAATPAAPATPTGPSPSSVPGLTAGTYSATCPQCSVVNGQISCACDVLPKA